MNFVSEPALIIHKPQRGRATTKKVIFTAEDAENAELILKSFSLRPLRTLRFMFKKLC